MRRGITEPRGTNHRKSLEGEPRALRAEVFLVRAVPDLPFLPQPCHGSKACHSPKQNKRANNLKGNLCYFLSPMLEFSEPASLGPHAECKHDQRGGFMSLGRYQEGWCLRVLVPPWTVLDPQRLAQLFGSGPKVSPVGWWENCPQTLLGLASEG